MTNKNKGFTLIELLVVIFIIGILAGLALVSFQGAKKTARDGKRKTDLEQIRSALEMYRADNRTYLVAGTGYNNCGCGWFNYEGGAYAKSVARGLVEGGYLSDELADPTQGTMGYMIYLCDSSQRYALGATLEIAPSGVDPSDYCNGSGMSGSYGKNYFVKNP